jgi:hypothetical protein
MGAYVFDNSWEKERVRLAGIEAMLDPGTRRNLDAVGVGAGWTCLEIGGGGGSIVQYIIATGTATVTRDGRRLATLGPGAFFGEMALLTHGPRTATVTADTAVKLLRLDERSFAALLKDAPTVARKVLEGVARRLREAGDPGGPADS